MENEAYKTTSTNSTVFREVSNMPFFQAKLMVDLKVPTLAEIKIATREALDKLRSDPKILDDLQKNLSATEFGEAAAFITLVVPASVVEADKAKKEAIRILSAQMQGDKSVARRLIDNKVQVVVVPRNKLMTELSQFASLKGKKTFDGRIFDTVRGSGGMEVDGKVYTAITEENLLGGQCNIVYNGKKLHCAYDEGYSTNSHEFAHTIHNFGISVEDKKIISEAYKKRKETAAKNLKDTNQWVDGREGCYASKTYLEFFAQLSNAYLGANGGKDPYTGDTRQNTKKWVKDHEPTIFKLLETFYNNASLPSTNPKK